MQKNFVRWVVLGAYLFGGPADAQSSAPTTTLELPDSILMKPRGQIPSYDPDPVTSEQLPTKLENQILDVPLSEVPYHSRNFVGIGFSYSNAGVTRGLFKISEDTALMGKVGESAWGLGVMLDMGWAEENATSFRMKWGIERVHIGLPSELRAQYGPDTLEESLSAITLDFLLREVLPAAGVELWWGGGLGLRYGWSSSTAGVGNKRISRLRNSTAISPLIGIGADVDLQTGHQLLLEADWLLLNAYQLTLGLRTQL